MFLLKFPIALARKAYLLVSAAFVGDSPCKGVAAPWEIVPTLKVIPFLSLSAIERGGAGAFSSMVGASLFANFYLEATRSKMIYF